GAAFAPRHPQERYRENNAALRRVVQRSDFASRSGGHTVAFPRQMDALGIGHGRRVRDSCVLRDMATGALCSSGCWLAAGLKHPRGAPGAAVEMERQAVGALSGPRGAGGIAGGCRRALRAALRGEEYRMAGPSGSMPRTTCPTRWQTPGP